MHPALHQVKHRAQEKATIGIAQHVTENLVQHSSSQAQWWKRSLEQIMAMFEKRGGKRIAEHGVERMAERGAERIAERGAERIAERGAERIAERGVERIAERGVERVLEGNVERIAERVWSVHWKEMQNASPNGAPTIYFTKEQDGFLQKTERVTESGMKRFVERNGERMAERALERSGERSLLRWEGRFAERLLPKLGRSISLALPALGALFGWYLFQQDLKRMSQEQTKRTKALFGVAAFTDFMDVVLHMWIIYALWAHLSHSSMIVAEK